MKNHQGDSESCAHEGSGCFGFILLICSIVLLLIDSVNLEKRIKRIEDKIGITAEQKENK